MKIFEEGYAPSLFGSQDMYYGGVKFDYPRYVRNPMPPMLGHDTAIVYPLFFAFDKPESEMIENLYYIINSAFWSMNSLYRHTDGQADILFFVERRLYRYGDVSDMFESAGIPLEHIILFDATPARHAVNKRFALKFEILKNERINQYETVMIWDTDLFLCHKDHEVIPISHLAWTAEDMTKMGVSWSSGILDPLSARKFWTKQYGIDCDSEAYGLFQTLVTKAIGHTLKENYVVGGQLYRYHPKLLGNIRAFLEKWEPDFGDDELLCSLYQTRFKDENDHDDCFVSLTDLWNIPMAWNMADTLKYREQGHYLSHFREDKGSDDWSDTLYHIYYGDIGVME